MRDKNKYNNNRDNLKVALLVQEVKRKKDIGRTLARIDQETMEIVNIKVGDVIALVGKKESVAIAWPSYPRDSGLGIIRIDSLLRKNSGTNIDETIQIRKVNAQPARNIDLTPIGVKIKNNPRYEAFFKQKLNNYPVTIDDLIYIPIGQSKKITFKVRNLKPNGICIIRPRTSLHISEYMIGDEEQNNNKKI